MSEHTEGPWYYDNNVGVVLAQAPPVEVVELGGIYHHADLHELSCVCTVTRFRTWDYWRGDKFYKIEQEVKDRLRARQDANARLITIAPEMLDLLKAYVANDPCAPNDPRHIEALRLIDKATREVKRTWTWQR